MEFYFTGMKLFTFLVAFAFKGRIIVSERGNISTIIFSKSREKKKIYKMRTFHWLFFICKHNNHLIRH